MKSNEASPFKLARYALSSTTVQNRKRGENPRMQLAEKTKPTNEIKMAEQNGEEKRLLSYKPSPLEAFSGWAGQKK